MKGPDRWLKRLLLVAKARLATRRLVSPAADAACGLTELRLAPAEERR